MVESHVKVEVLSGAKSTVMLADVVTLGRDISVHANVEIPVVLPLAIVTSKLGPISGVMDVSVSRLELNIILEACVYTGA